MTKLICISLIILLQIKVFASGISCHSLFEINSKITPTLILQPEQIVELSSKRKYKIHYKNNDLNSEVQEITVLLHGLGKDQSHFKYLKAELDKKNKNYLTFDLNLHGETDELNPQLTKTSRLDYKDNVQDLIELLSLIPSQIKINIIAHSYSGGVTLAALEKLETDKSKLIDRINLVTLASPYLKSLDKYYSEVAMNGQLPLVMQDNLNPILSVLGVQHHFSSINFKVRSTLVSGISPMVFSKDFILKHLPGFDLSREWAMVGPNYWSNLVLGPTHLLANSEIDEVRTWQKDPTKMLRVLFHNLATINGVRDLDFMNLTKPLKLPRNIKYNLVTALNDNVVPNSMTDEFYVRMEKEGYNIGIHHLPRQNHYYIYASDIKTNIDKLLSE